MELYYRDLISEDASLEKLVDDLMLVVQGAEELAEATGSGLGEGPKAELASRLQSLKAGCRRIQQQAVTTTAAADKVLRSHPYSAAGFAFAFGLLAGILIQRSRRTEP